MNLIKSTKFWNCTLAATAMVLDTSIEKLEEQLGHDGSEIVFPKAKSPGNRRGFCMQEIIDLAHDNGYAVVPIYKEAKQTNNGLDYIDSKVKPGRFDFYLKNYNGILQGERRQWWHSIAWDGVLAFDPRGYITTIDKLDIRIRLFWAFININIKK